MADKQLTVAELLARAEKENPSAARRPRRRRSLEDGGVSVAELTDSFKKVEVKPAEVKHSSVPIDAPAEEPVKKPAPKQEAPKQEAASVKVVPTKPAEPTEPTKPTKPADKPVEPKAERTEAITKTDAPRPVEDDTNVIPVVREDAAPAAPKPVQKPVPVQKPAPEQKPAAEADTTALVDEPVREDVVDKREADLDTFDEDARDIEVEEASVNPILMVLLVGLGVALGVLGFLAFKWLWANVMTVIAALLAVVAVVGVVLGVRAMRTGRDGLNMVLAGLAAAVMAFGPALI